ncbi:hypothetical protein PIB30_081730 [Stylosanthes scabra]|uniref:Uncharacterized protein n=1 Tax=Stylosanthes scabra TaxID=79078 RepID=A0ABU6SU08_9FABA|nr:hypothetical protein [Stylosanthes scabra]
MLIEKGDSGQKFDGKGDNSSQSRKKPTPDWLLNSFSSLTMKENNNKGGNKGDNDDHRGLELIETPYKSLTTGDCEMHENSIPILIEDSKAYRRMKLKQLARKSIEPYSGAKRRASGKENESPQKKLCSDELEPIVAEVKGASRQLASKANEDTFVELSGFGETPNNP